MLGQEVREVGNGLSCRAYGLEQGHLILFSDGNPLEDFNLENKGICSGILKAHSGSLVLWKMDFRGSRLEARRPVTKLLFQPRSEVLLACSEVLAAKIKMNIPGGATYDLMINRSQRLIVHDSSRAAQCKSCWLHAVVLKQYLV